MKTFSKLHKISLLILFSILSVGSFVVKPQSALAACNYTKADITSNKYNISNRETAKITLAIERGGNIADCDTNVKMTIYEKLPNGSEIPYAGGSQSFSFPGTTASFSIDLAMFTGVDARGYADIRAALETNSWLSRTQQITSSGFIRINIAGGQNNTGAVTMTLKFEPTKSEYTKGESIDIKVAPVGSTLRDMTDVTRVILKALIGSKTFEFETDKSNLVSGANYGEQKFTGIQITEANGFKNGANPVTVEIWKVGTPSAMLGSVNGSINATGLTTASPTPPAGGGGNNNGGGNNPPPGGTNPGTNPGGGGGSQIVGKLDSPIAIGNIGELIATILQYLLGLVAALAVLFIIIGGIRMVTSAGNTSSVTAGKQTVTWAIIGLVVSMLAFTIINVVQSLLKVR